MQKPQNMGQSLATGLFLAAVGIWLPFAHLYLVNAASFTLPISAHLPKLALLGGAVTVMAMLVQLIVPPRATTAVRTALLVFGIFLWAEGTLFIGNFGFITGGDLDWGGNRHLLFLEMLLLLVLGAVFVRGRGLFIRRSVLVMTLLTVSAAANLYAPWRMEQARTKLDVNHTFTRNGLFELSTERNVLIFILDTYQSDVFAEIIAENASWRQVFDGFTYFPNATSAFPKTGASIPNLLTGEAYDNSQPFSSYMRAAYLGNSVPRVLKRNGFDVRFYSFAWQPYFAHPDVADNLTGLGSKDEVRELRQWEFIQLANLLTFRLAPFAVKPWVYNGSRFRLSKRPAPDPVNGDGPLLTDLQRIYSAGNDAEDLEFLDEFLAFLDVGSDQPTCRVYHLVGVHAPFRLDPELRHIDSQAYAPEPFRDQSKAILKLMKLVFERLRAVGAYDNSLILMVGDHGNGELTSLDIRSDALVNMGGPVAAAVSDDPRLLEVMRGGIPVVLAKPPHTNGPLRISNAPVELADVPATVFQVLGLAETGQSFFEPDFDSQRKRLHRYYQFAGWGQDFIVPMTEYVIEGFSWDPGSWTLSGRNLNRVAASVQGNMAVLAEGGNLADYSHTGWSAALRQGRRIQADSASIVFQVPEDLGPSAIQVSLKHFSQNTTVPMKIYTDNDLAAVVAVGGGAPIRHTVYLPKGRLTPGSPVEVRFVLEPGSDPGSQFVEVRMDYHVERPVWPLGTQVFFANEAGGTQYLSCGWGVAEQQGTWTWGTQSEVSFALNRLPRGDLEVRVDLSAAVFGAAPPVRATILANDKVVLQLEIKNGQAHEYVFRISAAAVPVSGNMALVFKIDNPRSPRQYGLNDDPRPLGLELHSMLIKETGTSE